MQLCSRDITTQMATNNQSVTCSHLFCTRLDHGFSGQLQQMQEMRPSSEVTTYQPCICIQRSATTSSSDRGLPRHGGLFVVWIDIRQHDGVGTVRTPQFEQRCLLQKGSSPTPALAQMSKAIKHVQIIISIRLQIHLTGMWYNSYLIYTRYYFQQTISPPQIEIYWHELTKCTMCSVV